MARKRRANVQKTRQQKALKERRKDKGKKKRMAQRGAFSDGDPRSVIRRARQYPIFECLMNEEWHEEGLAHIVLSRKQSDTLVLFGVYLVDTYCLGLKNAFCNANISLTRYREVKADMAAGVDHVPCDVELAHQIIYGAIDYAATFGFKPHEDFALARRILEESETIPANEALEFGKDGMPLFVSGPDDNVAGIIAHLERKVGRGNFHFVAGGPIDDAFGDDVLDDYEDEDEDW